MRIRFSHKMFRFKPLYGRMYNASVLFWMGFEITWKRPPVMHVLFEKGIEYGRQIEKASETGEIKTCSDGHPEVYIWGDVCHICAFQRAICEKGYA